MSSIAPGRVLVDAADRSELNTVRERPPPRRPMAVYTANMFQTGNDADNRAAVRAVASFDLDLVGLALQAPATRTRHCADWNATLSAHHSASTLSLSPASTLNTLAQVTWCVKAWAIFG